MGEGRRGGLGRGGSGGWREEDWKEVGEGSEQQREKIDVSVT